MFNLTINLGFIITILSKFFPKIKNYYKKKCIDNYNFVRVEDVGDCKWNLYLYNTEWLNELLIKINGFGEIPIFKKINKNKIDYDNLIEFDIPLEYYSNYYNFEIGYTINGNSKKMNPMIRREINEIRTPSKLKLEFKIFNENKKG